MQSLYTYCNLVITEKDAYMRIIRKMVSGSERCSEKKLARSDRPVLGKLDIPDQMELPLQ